MIVRTLSSKDILFPAGRNDEQYTPRYAVEPIYKHLLKYAGLPPYRQDLIVWCPFDTADSEFVKVIGRQFEVVHSHISEGKDFFTYEPSEWDVMISNPPFTNKRKVFERAKELGKPYALLMSLTWLNDAAPKQVWGSDHELQLMMFDKRIRYNAPDGRPNNKITFSSAYYCWNFLKKQIVMEKLPSLGLRKGE